MKKLPTSQIIGMALCAVVVIAGLYFIFFASQPSTSELSSISSGVVPLPDISLTSPTVTDLESRQRFGAIPVTIQSGELGRPAPFSEF